MAVFTLVSILFEPTKLRSPPNDRHWTMTENVTESQEPVEEEEEEKKKTTGDNTVPVRVNDLATKVYIYRCIRCT